MHLVWMPAPVEMVKANCKFYRKRDDYCRYKRRPCTKKVPMCRFFHPHDIIKRDDDESRAIEKPGAIKMGKVVLIKKNTQPTAEVK